MESGCKLGDYQPLRRHLRPHKLGRAMQVSRKLKEIHPHFGPKLFLSDVFQTYITIGTEEDIGGGSFILYQEQERSILFVFRWRASLMPMMLSLAHRHVGDNDDWDDDEEGLCLWSLGSLVNCPLARQPCLLAVTVGLQP